MTHKIKEPQPSRFSQWLIKRIFKDEGEEKLGDFMEIYSTLAEERGQHQARLRFWWYLIRSIPEYFKDSLCIGGTMFKNYLKIAFRNIKRHKAYSFINIAGLTIGLAAFMLIFLYIRHELSYDKFHEDPENIYRVVMHQGGSPTEGSEWEAITPPILAPTLRQDVPDIIDIVRYEGDQKSLLTYKDKKIYEDGFCYTEPGFLDIFSFSVIQGDYMTALSEPFCLLITPKMAEKYFGTENPVGKTIRVDNNYDFQIKGIIEDCPENTHFQFDFLASFTTLEKIMFGDGDGFYSWGWNFHDTYFRLPDHTDPGEIEKKLSRYGYDVLGKRWSYHIQPLLNIHLQGFGDRKGESDIRYVYVFSVTAIFLLLIACFNYMNLSTARSESRAREIGIRKVVGADRNQLITQFLGESILFSFASFFISILLVYLMLPFFCMLIDKQLSFNLLMDGWILAALASVSILTGLLSGSYPAILLSSFNPVKTLKGNLQTDSNRTLNFRNSLVVAQFVMSVTMIMCTLVVYSQLSFIRNIKLGFNKSHIIVLPIRERNIQNNPSPLKNELSKFSKIEDITISSYLPIGIRTRPRADWEGNDTKDLEQISYTSGDYNFIDFYGMELIQGRKFSEKFSTDKNAYILNETAAKEFFRFDKPVGQEISLWGSKGTVIGVIKDFHSNSLHQKIEPVVLGMISSNSFSTARFFSIKINSYAMPNTIAFIEETWKKYSPYHPFEYFFIDERIDEMYRSDKKMGQIFSYFMIITIFVACLGLFGLALFTAERKKKEIGIRKVLGAKISNIIILLTKEFLFLVVLANMISWPIAYFFMNKWLQSFAYRMSLEIWIFILSGLLALAIALLTVSFQSIKAATANPVDSLRYE